MTLPPLPNCSMNLKNSILLANGTQIVNVSLQIKSRVGQGLPELGLIVSGGSSQSSCGSQCEIKQVMIGSAAAAAMVAEGDRISQINNTDVSRMQIEEVVALLRKAAIDSKWTYSPVRLQLIRDSRKKNLVTETEDLMTLMTIAIRKNTKMVSSKKPNPIRQTLLQRGFCDSLDKALAANGYYDVTYTL